MTKAKTIIFDCDGVLTDGRVTYSENGERQKTFHSRDIYAIKRLIAAGYGVLILSKSKWKGLEYFAKRCQCNWAFNVKDKAEYVKQWQMQDNEMQPFIAVCDDYEDLELCKLAELVILPNDHNEMLLKLIPKEKRITLNKNGGDAVAEAVEIVLIKFQKAGLI